MTKPAVPGAEAVFINRLFHAYAAGEDATVPVSPNGTLWPLSVTACVQALLHAATLPAATIGADRAVTLPALRVTLQMLIDALARRHPQAGTTITFAPQPRIQAQFASQPPLSTPTADRLGFRHDDDMDRLVARATA